MTETVTVNGREWVLVNDRGEWTVQDARTGGYVHRDGTSKLRYFPTRDRAVEYLEKNY